jgi:RNA polymerase sigma-70 factor (ECF subfamily)
LAKRLSYPVSATETAPDSAAEASDEELIARARAETDAEAQSAALDKLFRRYHSRIALWCLRITGDREKAADLAQEVLLKVYRNLDSFRGDAKFSTWLYSVTRNHCFNQLQSRAVRREHLTDPLEDDFPAVDRFDLQMERGQQLRQMRELLHETLDEVELQVMTLHYGEEMPLETVTRLLQLRNATGAKAYIVSARRKLKTAVARKEAQSLAVRRTR